MYNAGTYTASDRGIHWYKVVVRAELSRDANVVWHVTDSKVKTDTCLCVGNVVSCDTRINGNPAETSVLSTVFGHFNLLFSIHFRNRKGN